MCLSSAQSRKCAAAGRTAGRPAPSTAHRCYRIRTCVMYYRTFGYTCTPFSSSQPCCSTGGRLYVKVRIHHYEVDDIDQANMGTEHSMNECGFTLVHTHCIREGAVNKQSHRLHSQQQQTPSLHKTPGLKRTRSGSCSSAILLPKSRYCCATVRNLANTNARDCIWLCPGLVKAI